MLTAIDSILSVIIVTEAWKANAKIRESDPTWSQTLFFLVTTWRD